MVWYTVHYSFSQRFKFPLQEAWRWSTDYDENDIALTGQNGKREIERLNQDTLVLTDSYYTDGRTTTKRRLIRLFPELHMLTNTRLSSANRHSQFIYQFVSEGRNRSRLDFTGAQVNRSRNKPAASKVAALAGEYERFDSRIWVNLAAAMEKDLAGRA